MQEGVKTKKKNENDYETLLSWKTTKMTITYSKLHPTRWNPIKLLLEENFPCFYFSNVAPEAWKEEFSTYTKNEKRLRDHVEKYGNVQGKILLSADRKKLVDVNNKWAEIQTRACQMMLLGENIVVKDDLAADSRIFDVPVITNRKRNGKKLNVIRYNFNTNEVFYGQIETVAQENSVLHERLSALEQRVNSNTKEIKKNSRTINLVNRIQLEAAEFCLRGRGRSKRVKK